MAYELLDLVVDRVDLVDEGANSEAFIELYKRKEKSPMTYEEIVGQLKPEHAEVVKGAFADVNKKYGDLEATNAELAKRVSDLEEELAKACGGKETEKRQCTDKSCKKASCDGCEKASGASFDETETFKSMPEELKQMFLKMRQQNAELEEQVAKAADEKATAAAVAKAATLKSLPVEQDKLVAIIKSATPEVISVLEASAAAIDSAVLGEVGKNRGNGADTNTTTGGDAYARIEAKAAEIAKSRNITKEAAFTAAVRENPDLYQEYVKEGA